MTALLIGALIVGPLVAEIALRTLGGERVRTHAMRILELLRAFRAAADDDQRQALLLSSGTRLLSFSLQMLVLTVALLALAFAPPWLLRSPSGDQLVYFAATTLTATAWLLFRRARRRNAVASPPDVRL